MNKRQFMMNLNQWLNSYEQGGQKPKLNFVKLVSNGNKHEAKKFEEAMKHHKECGYVITDAKNKATGFIPDLICFRCGEIEIVDTSASENCTRADVTVIKI